MTRSFDSLLSVPLGVEPEGVLTFEVNLPGARYTDGEARQRFHEVFWDVGPLGQQIQIAGGLRRIMGIVENIPEDARGGMSRKSYVPHAQQANGRNWALIQTVKARGDLAELRESIRGELRAMDTVQALRSD